MREVAQSCRGVIRVASCNYRSYTDMQLQLHPYRRRIQAHGVFITDAAVVASLGVCCRNQSRCEDQSQHLAAGTVKALSVYILSPVRTSKWG